MNGNRLLSVLRRDRAVVLGCLGVVVLLAWAYILAGGAVAMPKMPMGGTMGAMPEWTLGYAGLVFVMWCVMMAAMMLPSTAPVTLLVARIAGQRAGGATLLFVLGYLSVWFAFSVAATALQWALNRAGLLSDGWALANSVLAGVVLLAAGIYQWTPLKAACLRHCRSPLDFILFRWREGPIGAFASGAGHGFFCLGCCWMLMALLFVGGIMSVVWIGAIALLVLVEKTLPWGEHAGRLAGGALAVWGIGTLAMAI